MNNRKIKSLNRLSILWKIVIINITIFIVFTAFILYNLFYFVGLMNKQNNEKNQNDVIILSENVYNFYFQIKRTTLEIIKSNEIQELYNENITNETKNNIAKYLCQKKNSINQIEGCYVILNNSDLVISDSGVMQRVTLLEEKYKIMQIDLFAKNLQGNINNVIMHDAFAKTLYGPKHQILQ